MLSNVSFVVNKSLITVFSNSASIFLALSISLIYYLTSWFNDTVLLFYLLIYVSIENSFVYFFSEYYRCVQGARCRRYCIILSLSFFRCKTRIEYYSLIVYFPNILCGCVPIFTISIENLKYTLYKLYICIRNDTYNDIRNDTRNEFQNATNKYMLVGALMHGCIIPRDR